MELNVAHDDVDLSFLSDYDAEQEEARAAPAPAPVALTIAAAEAAEDAATAWDPLASGYVSERGLAEGLAITGWNRDARFVTDTAAWIFFDNATGWRADEKGAARHKVGEFLQGVADDLTQRASGDDRTLKAARATAKSILSLSAISAVEQLARSNPLIAIKAEALDTDPMLLGTPDGVIDLRTGDLMPHSRDHLVTMSTAMSPAAPGAVPARWLTFLAETLDGDQDRIDMVRREAGYAMTGVGKERAIFYHQGGGGDGKSTLFFVLEEILGGYGQSAHIDTFLQKPAGFSGHPTDLAKLHGARLVVAPEAPTNAVWNEQILKMMTGGDKVSARKMRKDFFDFRSSAALLISGNSMPSFATMDDGIRDRFILIQHPRKFSGTAAEDRGLQDYLVNVEGPAILRWCIDAAREYLEIGLDVPASIRQASGTYLDGEDKVGAWIADHAEIVDGAYEATADLFASFRPWIEAQGHRDWTQGRFGKELKKRRLEDARTSGSRGFRGIRLLTEAEAHERKAEAAAAALGKGPVTLAAEAGNTPF